ncbi:hypothetical protein [Ruminococcus champanellensis]|uniref:hypothetical protein n=1 Tax=Ruminococcus champanellensis TaxID=1161942 RepID=UPI0023F334C2|nr:hypothetical protein [Ruminococcus champanellensis]
MKKALKRTLALLMATASLTVSLGGMSVHAANTRDTRITDFTAAPGIADTYTELPVTKDGVRVKTNNSSVYIYLTAADYPVYVQTWGLSDTNWSSAVANRTCNASGRTTSRVTVRVGKYVVKNLIHERGDACAGLKFGSTSYYNPSTIKGVWSPDYSGNLNVTVAN